MDNIGGVQRIEVLHINQVKSFAIILDDAVLETLSPPIAIPFTPGTAKVQSPYSSETGISIYHLEVELQVPASVHCPHFRGQHYIVLATTTGGDTYVLGSLNYPLLANDEPLIPGAPAGYSGRKIKFTGVSYWGGQRLKEIF